QKSEALGAARQGLGIAMQIEIDGSVLAPRRHPPAFERLTVGGGEQFHPRTRQTSHVELDVTTARVIEQLTLQREHRAANQEIKANADEQAAQQPLLHRPDTSALAVA